jgi:hypothetical protein
LHPLLLPIVAGILVIGSATCILLSAVYLGNPLYGFVSLLWIGWLAQDWKRHKPKLNDRREGYRKERPTVEEVFLKRKS